MKLHLLCEHKKEIIQKGFYTEPDEIFASESDSPDAVEFIARYCQIKKIGHYYVTSVSGESQKDTAWKRTTELSIPGVSHVATRTLTAEYSRMSLYEVRLQVAEDMKKYLISPEGRTGQKRKHEENGSDSGNKQQRKKAKNEAVLKVMMNMTKTRNQQRASWKASSIDYPLCETEFVDVANLSFHFTTLHHQAWPADDLIDSCYVLYKTGTKKSKCRFCTYNNSHLNSKQMKLHLLCEHRDEIMERGYTYNYKESEKTERANCEGLDAFTSSPATVRRGR